MLTSLSRRILVIMIGTLSFLAPARAEERGPLVLAAASLQESLSAAANSWAAKGNPRPVISFAATSALARQVEAGAPADLFIAADEEWMDELARKGLIRPASRKSLLANRLVLIAPATNPVRLEIRKGFPLARALGDGRLAMADPDAVPAGRYARAALASLGIWPALSSRIAAAENVRAALSLVERGAAPLGIVYATDARASTRVRVVGLFPTSSHPPISYPVARLSASRHSGAAAFEAFLSSREARAIFARFGFSAR